MKPSKAALARATICLSLKQRDGLAREKFWKFRLPDARALPNFHVFASFRHLPWVISAKRVGARSPSTSARSAPRPIGTRSANGARRQVGQSTAVGSVLPGNVRQFSQATRYSRVACFVFGPGADSLRGRLCPWLAKLKQFVRAGRGFPEVSYPTPHKNAVKAASIGSWRWFAGFFCLARQGRSRIFPITAWAEMVSRPATMVGYSSAHAHAPAKDQRPLS